MAVSKRPPIFERLVGLETEYALRFQPLGCDAGSPSRFALFRSLLAAVRQRVLTVVRGTSRKAFSPPTVGLCGSRPSGWRRMEAWWRVRPPSAAGSVNCCSISERRMSCCPVRHEVHGEGRLSLIENCRDSQDHRVRHQENYEADVASGWRLAVWRLGLVLLFPLVVSCGSGTCC